MSIPRQLFLLVGNSAGDTLITALGDLVDDLQKLVAGSNADERRLAVRDV